MAEQASRHRVSIAVETGLASYVTFRASGVTWWCFEGEDLSLCRWLLPAERSFLRSKWQHSHLCCMLNAISDSSCFAPPTAMSHSPSRILQFGPPRFRVVHIVRSLADCYYSDVRNRSPVQPAGNLREIIEMCPQ